MAVERLRSNLSLASSSELNEPQFVPWQADYIEALAGAGKRADAIATLEAFEREGATVGSNWVAATASRCRVVLADQNWRDHGEHALSVTAALPIERARTHLALGRQYRRGRERQIAGRHLAEALRIFQIVGAKGWEAEAEQQLHAAGYRPTASTRPKTSLTPQELRVCKAAAEGASNKEIAARLYLSTKTVEFHLAKAFAKLGVTNRTQAARALDNPV